MLTGKEIVERCRERGATVLGFGISNVPLTEFLLAEGVKVNVRDGKSREKVAEVTDVDAYEKRGVSFVFGEGYLDSLDAGVLFRTPGLRPDADGITDALRRGATLTSEMELFYALCPSHKLAITGSDGKTTTTTLTNLILTEATKDENVKVGLGGNIGAPLLPRAYELTERDYAVTELSSFQLMTMPVPPEVAVITNVSPNHLNWHTDMEEYTEAKLRVLGDGCRYAVLNRRDAACRAAETKTEAEITWFSSAPVEDDVQNAVYLDGDEIIYRKNGVNTPVLSRSAIKLPGLHNVENYMAAIAAVGAYVPTAVLAAAADKIARTFGGVPHRLEFVRKIGGISAYNGSIDSSPSRTAAALSALHDKTISLICGGYDKHIPMEPLAEAIASHGGVLFVTLTGDIAPIIASALDKKRAEGKGDVPEYEVIPDFDEAVRYAFDRAGVLGADTLLLSPAAASFDHFRNFEERGEYYKSLIRVL